jgi:hypothetical protein
MHHTNSDPRSCYRRMRIEQLQKEIEERQQELSRLQQEDLDQFFPNRRNVIRNPIQQIDYPPKNPRIVEPIATPNQVPIANIPLNLPKKDPPFLTPVVNSDGTIIYPDGTTIWVGGNRMR